MRRLGTLMVAALLLGAASGCGTAANVAGTEVWLLNPGTYRPIVPFGGVGNDVRWMARGPGAVVPAAIDMPFSLVGDVVTLPWTMYHWLYLNEPIRATTNAEDTAKDAPMRERGMEHPREQRNRVEHPVLPTGGLRDDVPWANPGKK